MHVTFLGVTGTLLDRWVRLPDALGTPETPELPTYSGWAPWRVVLGAKAPGRTHGAGEREQGHRAGKAEPERPSRPSPTRWAVGTQTPILGQDGAGSLEPTLGREPPQPCTGVLGAERNRQKQGKYQRHRINPANQPGGNTWRVGQSQHPKWATGGSRSLLRLQNRPRAAEVRWAGSRGRSPAHAQPVCPGPEPGRVERVQAWTRGAGGSCGHRCSGGNRTPGPAGVEDTPPGSARPHCWDSPGRPGEDAAPCGGALTGGA